MKSHLRDLGVCLALLVLPAAEVAWLHHAVHRAYGANNTVIGIYSRDVYIPFLIGIVMILIWLRRDGVKLAWQPAWTVLNLISLTVALAVLTLSPSRIALGVSAEAEVAFLLSSALVAITTSLFIWIPPGQLVRRVRQHSGRGVCLALALWCLVAYPMILSWLWPTLSYATGRSVSELLALFGYPLRELSFGSSFILRHARFAASINMGCSGLEGIFFFLFTFFLTLSFRVTQTARTLWNGRNLLMLLSGCLYMFVLNLLRVTAFFVFALYLEENYVDEAGRRFFEWAFHENLGWALYAPGLLLFFAVWRAAGGKKNPPETANLQHQHA